MSLGMCLRFAKYEVYMFIMLLKVEFYLTVASWFRKNVGDLGNCASKNMINVANCQKL